MSVLVFCLTRNVFFFFFYKSFLNDLIKLRPSSVLYVFDLTLLTIVLAFGDLIHT